MDAWKAGRCVGGSGLKITPRRTPFLELKEWRLLVGGGEGGSEGKGQEVSIEIVGRPRAFQKSHHAQDLKNIKMK